MLSKEILVRDWNVWQNSWKWKGADLVTCSSSSSFYIFPRLFPIDHRFNSMKNEEGSLSLFLSYFTRSKGFIFLSFLSTTVTECFFFTCFLPPFLRYKMPRVFVHFFSTFEQTPYILLYRPRIFHKLYCFREFLSKWEEDRNSCRLLFRKLCIIYTWYIHGI